MRGPTLPFAPTKTYDPIAVNLREKIEILSLEIFLFPLTHTSLSPPLLLFLLTFFFFILSFFFLIFGCMCPFLIRVRFFPEIIYFSSIQFILNELSSSHFLTSEIFAIISSLELLMTYHPENRNNIPTVLEIDETFPGYCISRDESNGAVRFIIRNLENFLGFRETL